MSTQHTVTILRGLTTDNTVQERVRGLKLSVVIVQVSQLQNQSTDFFLWLINLLSGGFY